MIVTYYFINQSVSLLTNIKKKVGQCQYGEILENNMLPYAKNNIRNCSYNKKIIQNTCAIANILIFCFSYYYRKNFLFYLIACFNEVIYLLK